MKLWEQFPIFSKRLIYTAADADKRAKERAFYRNVESIERTLKRSLRGSELRVVFTFDGEQTELLKNLLKEANI